MKILFVEDEPRIRSFILQGLQSEDYELLFKDSAEDALVFLNTTKVDLLVLDVMLPGMSGVDLCRKLRSEQHKEPILILSAMNRLEEKVAGLESGADDYLTKPFDVLELKARIQALLRKTMGYPQEPLLFLDLELDPESRFVTLGEQKISLSEKESALLQYLIRNQGRVVTRAMISKEVWDSETSTFTNVIDVFINHLRKKLEIGDGRKLIHTVRGRGFILTSQYTEGDGIS